MRRTAAATCLALALAAGCGHGDQSSSRSGSPLLRDGGDLLVDCGNGTAFPTGVMDDGLDVPSLDSATVAASLRRVVNSFGDPSSDPTWKVLVAEPADDPTMLLVAVGDWSRDTGPAGELDPYAKLQRDGDGWRAMQWGNCNLAPALGVGSSWAHLALEVSERECASARDPSSYLHEPYVVATDDAVTVYWTTNTPSGDLTCPSNPAVRRRVELSEPLGTRTVYDGSVWPPRGLRGAAQ
jgi:hypothetical protein